ncbi:hypothetical protein Sjap_025117 [Stephania japonica]|uniref:Wax synthase domain-containing protein n=1 Tax=Stephania japonica TaxID=461633 RepID=A0AAP0HHN1_9MAGN
MEIERATIRNQYCSKMSSSTASGEINNLIKVWLTVLTSLTYSYFISSKIRKGLPRLLSLLPIITLFFLLPLAFSTVHLSGITGFFVAWLANFKLLLFAFDLPPLVSPPHSPKYNLLHFISLSCLPIKITTQNPNKAKPQVQLPLMNYIIMSLVVVLSINIYNYKHYLHPKLLQLLYCIHIYCILEVLLMISTRVASIVLLRIDLEAPFNEPYRSTSLQDFWGRRWNLMVTGILRPTVYKPVRGYFGERRWAVPTAMIATFVVSGAMHELIFFYLSRQMPDGGMMGFFVLHGVCLVVEISVKKRLQWRLGVAVSMLFTGGFIAATALWLFVPHMVRRGVDTRGMEEYVMVARYAQMVLKLGENSGYIFPSM